MSHWLHGMMHLATFEACLICCSHAYSRFFYGLGQVRYSCYVAGLRIERLRWGLPWGAID